MKKILLTFFIFTFFLTGCSSNKNENETSLQSEIDKMILDSAVQIQDQQTALFMAGALNQITIKPKVTISDENKYTVIWYGDAVELLSRIAHDQKMNFEYSGIRLPLPVSIRSIDTPLSETLNTIQSQIEYRSTIKKDGNTLRLSFIYPNIKP